MHACSICHNPCSCGGDTDQVVITIAEAPGCTCCIADCEHGLEFGKGCALCETEGFEPEPDAQPLIEEEAPPPIPVLNGGW